MRPNRDIYWLALVFSVVAGVIGLSAGIVGFDSAFRFRAPSVNGLRLGMGIPQVIDRVGQPVRVVYWGDYEALCDFSGGAGEVSVHFRSTRPLRTYGAFGVRQEGLDGKVVAVFGTTLELNGEVIASNHMSLNDLKSNLSKLGPSFEYSQAPGSKDTITVWYKAKVAVYSVGDTVKQIRLGDTSFAPNVVPWSPTPSFFWPEGPLEK
jgi:hypothetical protein